MIETPTSNLPNLRFKQFQSEDGVIDFLVELQPAGASFIAMQYLIGADGRGEKPFAHISREYYQSTNDAIVRFNESVKDWEETL